MSELQLPHKHNQDQEHGETLAKLAAVNDFQMTADVFKQIGDGSRLRIFWLLCHCEECVTNIGAMVDMSSPAVSHHLKQLKAAGLISCRRDGKEMYYKASDSKQSDLLHNMIEQLMDIICPED